MSNPKTQFPVWQGLLVINLSTLCISITGPIARSLEMSPPAIIYWRTLGAVVLLWVLMRLRHSSFTVTRKDLRMLVLAGLLLGTHWITYFYALQLSNVAIGMLSLFTFPVVTVLLEPLFFPIKLKAYRVLLSVVLLVGVYFLVPAFDFADSYFVGVLFGVFSGLCYALRNFMMKRFTAKYSGETMMFYQQLALVLLTWPLLLFFDWSTIGTEWHWVITMSLVASVIGHTLFVRAHAYFDASMVGILSSTQPLFGIVLAAIFLDEVPGWRTMVGGSIILSTIIIESLFARRARR